MEPVLKFTSTQEDVAPIQMCEAREDHGYGCTLEEDHGPMHVCCCGSEWWKDEYGETHWVAESIPEACNDR